MANWCSVEAEIDCFDSRQAETLYQKLVAAKTDADKRNQGFYVGSDRYFFDALIELFDNTVTLTGSVKWGFYDEEMISFIKLLLLSKTNYIVPAEYDRLESFNTANGN